MGLEKAMKLNTRTKVEFTMRVTTLSSVFHLANVVLVTWTGLKLAQFRQGGCSIRQSSVAADNLFP